VWHAKDSGCIQKLCNHRGKTFAFFIFAGSVVNIFAPRNPGIEKSDHLLLGAFPG
jgi:hypothetical protein